MKVAVIEFFTNPGGTATVLENVLPELVLKGLDVVFIDPISRSYSKDFGVETVQISAWPNWSVVSHENQLISLIKKSITIIGYGLYAIRLSIWLRVSKIDVIYVHLKKGIVLGSIISKISGIPVIAHAHGFENPSDIGLMHKISLSSTKHIIAVSNDTRKVLIERGIDDQKITTIYNGVNISKWQNHLTSPPVLIPTIIFVGSIQQRKGLHILVKAVANLVADGMEVRLRVVGETPTGGDKKYESEIKNLIGKIGLSEHISFLGQRSNISEIISEATILVLPSLTRSESFGMVLIEAGALGVLAIGSDIGGIPEVLGDSDLTFLPNNVDDLTLKLKIALSDAKWRSAKTNRFTNHVKNNFNVEIQADRIIEVFKKYV